MKPYIIAIAGGTCSGKSTLTEKLENYFSNVTMKIFHMDDYFKKCVPTTISPISGKEYPEHNHPNTLDLEKLYSDFFRACDDKKLQLIIVEGLFSLYLTEIREKADLKIFVDLSGEDRIVRRIKRFSNIGQSFDEITERYLDTVRYRHNELVEPTRWHADIVINGTMDKGIGIKVIIDFIENQIK